MKKKILALCLVIVLAITAVTGATLAYFTDSDQNTNEFAVGSVTIDLYEDVAHEDGVGNEKQPLQEDLGIDSKENPNVKYEDIQPGDTMTKVATVENTGKSTAYIALAIKQANYDIFNDHVDGYYEKFTSNQRYDLMGKPMNNDEFMQQITNDVFCGTGWGLQYTKTANSLRYMMVNSQGTPEGDVQVLGHGYTNVSASSGKRVWNYAGDIFKNVKSQTELEGNFQSLDGDYTRMWVIYLEVPAGASYTVDLTTVCPAYFDNTSAQAFGDMSLDIKAFAIQKSGFATPKDAFTELFKAKDCFAF